MPITSLRRYRVTSGATDRERRIGIGASGGSIRSGGTISARANARGASAPQGASTRHGVAKCHDLLQSVTGQGVTLSRLSWASQSAAASRCHGVAGSWWGRWCGVSMEMEGCGLPKITVGRGDQSILSPAAALDGGSAAAFRRRLQVPHHDQTLGCSVCSSPRQQGCCP
jgi:hypothetical protein